MIDPVLDGQRIVILGQRRVRSRRRYRASGIPVGPVRREALGLAVCSEPLNDAAVRPQFASCLQGQHHARDGLVNGVRVTGVSVNDGRCGRGSVADLHTWVPRMECETRYHGTSLWGSSLTTLATPGLFVCVAVGPLLRAPGGKRDCGPAFVHSRFANSYSPVVQLAFNFSRARRTATATSWASASGPAITASTSAAVCRVRRRSSRHAVFPGLPSWGTPALPLGTP